MNILVLTSSYPTCESGPHSPRFVADLTENLTARNIRPVVLAPHFPGGPVFSAQNGVRICRFPYFFPVRLERLAYGAGLLFNVRKDFFAFAGVIPFCVMEFLWTAFLLKCEKPGLVHSHWLIPQGLAGAIAHRVLGIPHVTTIHGSDLNLLKRNTILRSLCRFIIRNSSAVTVNSSYMKNELVAVAPGYEKKIRVIPMGVDSLHYRDGIPGGNQNARRERHTILSIGRFIDWKGTRYLVEAMPEILRAVPDARLMLIGSGPEERHLRQRVSDLSLDSYVVFPGNVSSQEIQNQFATASVFALPSIEEGGNTEALGVVLLEAMASGCPVIGSNVGGIPDIIVDGECGFLVPQRDPMAIAQRVVQILQDDDLREKFRQNGQDRIRQSFSWDTISRQFAGLYREVSPGSGVREDPA